jgi:LCP family protein required for cell wall assembly
MGRVAEEGAGPRHRAPEEAPRLPADLISPAAPPRAAGPHSRVAQRRARAAAGRSRLRKVLLGLFGVLVVAAGLVIGLGTLQVEGVAGDVARVEDPFPAEEGRPAEATDESLTFLVVGVDPSDRATGTTRAEAALLLRLTGDRQHAQVVSLPLDTWVDGQSTTVEDAFGASGPAGAVSAVETLTDVRVDHYAELDYGGLGSVVDTLGGVTVDVPERYTSQGRSFEPGPQQMDGGEAVAYLRDASAATRSGAAARQQRVVQALFERIRDRGAFTDVGSLRGLLGSVTDTVRVDETLADEDLVATAWEFRGVGDPEFVSAPVGASGTEGGRQVVHLDDGRASALWGHLRDDDLAAYVDDFR